MKACEGAIFTDQKHSNTGGPFLVVEWLRLQASKAGGTGSIPGTRTKIRYHMQCSQNEEEGKKKKNEEKEEEQKQKLTGRETVQAAMQV